MSSSVTVTTMSATDLYSTTVNLWGSVTVHSNESQNITDLEAWFEYKEYEDLSWTQAPETPIPLDATLEDEEQVVDTPVTGLSPGTLYEFRVVAGYNDGGWWVTTEGSIKEFNTPATGDLEISVQSAVDFDTRKKTSGDLEILLASSFSAHGIDVQPGVMNIGIIHNEDFLGKKVVTSPHIGDYRWALHHETDLSLELDLDKQFYLSSSYQHLFGYMFGLESQVVSYQDSFNYHKIATSPPLYTGEYHGFVDYNIILESELNLEKDFSIEGSYQYFFEYIFGFGPTVAYQLESTEQKVGQGLLEELTESYLEASTIKIAHLPEWEPVFSCLVEFEGNKVWLFFTWIYLQGRLYRSVGLEGRLYAEEEMQGRLGVV